MCVAGFTGAVALLPVKAELPVEATPLPFSETFTSEDALDAFTVLDVDGNGLTWRHDGNAVCNPGNQDNSDDWLITPGFYMEAGKMYTVRFRAYGSSYWEMFEVKYGTTPTPAGLTETFIPVRSVEGNSFSPLDYEDVIVPASDGIYYIGFHSITADRNFYLDDIAVDAPVVKDAPGTVTDFTVVADPTGLNKATVSLTAPSVTVSGESLTAIDGIRIMRGDEPVANITEVTPGEKISVTDEVSAAGLYTYTAFAFNENGTSADVSATVWVGANKPLPVGNLEAWETENDGEVTVYWTVPDADIDGKELDPSLLTYRVIEITDGHEVVVAENHSRTSYTYTPQLVDTQEFKSWAVEAVSAAGASRRSYTSIMAVGTPLTMPFAESFAAGKTSTPCLLQSIDGDAAWDFFIDGKMVKDVFSQDNDGGFAGMRGQDMSSAAICTGKIKIEGENPALMLFVHSFGPSDDNEMEIYAQEGDNLTLLSSFELSELPERGWNYVTIPMKKFIGHQVQFMFMATVWAYNYTFLDNIRVDEAVDCDLAALMITAPAEVVPAEDFDVTVTVENLGLETADIYTVSLYRDGQLLDSRSGESLASGKAVRFTFSDRLGVTSPAMVSYHAEVAATDDTLTDNNISRAVTVSLLLPSYPVVTDLSAEKTENTVTLSWSAPDVSAGIAEPVTETFENCEPFATSIPGWTFIDADGGKIGGLGVGTGNQVVDIPGIAVDSPQSWWVWDLETLPLQADGDVMAAASGSRFLAQMYNYDPEKVVPCDDWAISPRLSGDAQTISLMARSFQKGYSETFEILYSTGSLNPDDFTLVEEKYMIPSEWKLYTFDLPDGAEYFAIRCTSSNKFMLFVDDVTFIPAETNAELVITGYNIYRDGLLLTPDPVTETSYIDRDLPEGDHVYHVTTVYDRGESAVSNPAVPGSSGIAGVSGNDNIVIAGLPGEIVVGGADGIRITVFTIDGRYVAGVTGTAETHIPLSSGIYIVRAASQVAKVLVK